METRESVENLLTVEQAIGLIRQHVRPLGVEEVDLGAAVGRRLAEEVLADLDSPPFAKSVMDGFAVCAADCASIAQFPVVATVLAGTSGSQRLPAGAAVRIMTGAPLPDGADAVIPHERAAVESRNGEEWVRFGTDQVLPGSHVMQRGRSIRAGQTVFARGHRMRGMDTGLLAEAGRARPKVYRRPEVAVLATGDELVPCVEVPQGACIRNSNGPMLAAMALPHAAAVKDLGVARDQREELLEKICSGLDSDLLILAGGVSAGLADLVPATLAELGVQQLFHRIAMKPGKPLWFGIRPAGESRGGVTTRACIVFGLPGNPVSSLVCFELFVREAMELLAGLDPAELQPRRMGVLDREHQTRGPRPTWWPMVQGFGEDGQVVLIPLPWQGSSDLACLGRANAIAHFPPRTEPWPAGSRIEWRSLGLG